MLSLFRVLEVHFFHVEIMGIAPASVGLGQIPKLNPHEGASEGGNPLLESLKSLVLNYISIESSQVDPGQDVIGSIIFSTPAACSRSMYKTLLHIITLVFASKQRQRGYELLAFSTTCRRTGICSWHLGSLNALSLLELVNKTLSGSFTN